VVFTDLGISPLRLVTEDYLAACRPTAKRKEQGSLCHLWSQAAVVATLLQKRVFLSRF